MEESAFQVEESRERAAEQGKQVQRRGPRPAAITTARSSDASAAVEAICVQTRVRPECPEPISTTRRAFFRGHGHIVTIRVTPCDPWWPA